MDKARDLRTKTIKNVLKNNDLCSGGAGSFDRTRLERGRANSCFDKVSCLQQVIGRSYLLDGTIWGKAGLEKPLLDCAYLGSGRQNPGVMALKWSKIANVHQDMATTA